MKKDLRKFDPNKVAELDLEMWQAYYDHNFFKLFILLLRLMHKFFGLDYFSAFRAAFYSASAVIDFRINKGRENSERIRRKLTKFFKIISSNNKKKFNYEKAAELELKWWLVDRYPERYEISREEGLANAMAIVYNINPEKLLEYAIYRAQAMLLQDKAEKEKGSTDWGQIGILLKKSFNSLYKSIQ